MTHCASVCQTDGNQLGAGDSFSAERRRWKLDANDLFLHWGPVMTAWLFAESIYAACSVDITRVCWVQKHSPVRTTKQQKGYFAFNSSWRKRFIFNCSVALFNKKVQVDLIPCSLSENQRSFCWTATACIHPGLLLWKVNIGGVVCILDLLRTTWTFENSTFWGENICFLTQNASCVGETSAT